MSDKYELIDAEYANAPAGNGHAPTITCMCRWLGVAKSGFYEWRSRPESATTKRQERLRRLIKEIFDDSDGTYGYRRLAAQLARQGVVAGRELVRKLMRELGLVACQPRPWRPSTTEQGAAGPIPEPGQPGLQRGKARAENGRRHYLHPDVARMGISRDGDRLRDPQGHRLGDGRQLQDAADHHGDRDGARNIDLPADAVFHSDRGSNYTSAEFAGVLAGLGIRQSVGRTGICFDNALAESFNAAVKVERVHRTAYPTRKKAREDIARLCPVIEIRYNCKRLHSALGYRTPQEAHDEYLNRQLAA